MTIYLKRNNEHDANFETNNGDSLIKKGYIYELLSITPFGGDMPASVRLKVKVRTRWLKLYADLNCFDYMKKVNHAK